MTVKRTYAQWREYLSKPDAKLTLDEFRAATELDQAGLQAQTVSLLMRIETHVDRATNGRLHNLEVWLVMLSRWIRGFGLRDPKQRQIPVYPETVANKPELEEVQSLLDDDWQDRKAIRDGKAKELVNGRQHAK